MSPPVGVCLLFSLVAILLRQYSSDAISFDYPNFGGQNTITGHCPGGDPIICLRGNATVDNSAIFLTQDRMWQSGVAYYSKPVHLWDNSTGNLLLTNFTTNFSFLITRNEPNSSGDGLAFFLFSYPLPNIARFSPGGRLGLQSFDSSIPGGFVAVEIDTHKNEWDGPVPHVGIDNNSMISVESRSMEEYESATTIKCKAFVRYYSSNTELSVSLTCDPDREYTLSHAMDLRSTFTEKYVTIGFTGNTGGSTQTNQVSSWSFDSTLDGILEEERRELPAGNKKKKVITVVVTIALVVLILLALVVAILIWYRSPKPPIAPAPPARPARIALDQILEATHNFDEGLLLGGGESTVYKGFLGDSEVAIKRFSGRNDMVRSKYTAEVRVIGQLRFCHLVQLLGWCDEGGEFLLVYEFVPKLSLALQLFDREENSLPWKDRYRISLQIASASLNLHQDYSDDIAHRNFKANNVLLDNDLNAKLGDFGVARLTRHGWDMHSTAFRSSIGYIAPECFQTYTATIKSDVYAFGVLLLQIATGRMVKQLTPEGEPIHLVQWVWDLYDRGETRAAADPRLGDNFDERQMERLLFVGLSCADPDLHTRPHIRNAMSALRFEEVRIAVPSRRPETTVIYWGGAHSDDRNLPMPSDNNHVVILEESMDS